MLPTILVAKAIERVIFTFLLYIVVVLAFIEIIKQRTGLVLSQQTYIDSLKHMKTRISKEEYNVFFSMIIGLSNIVLFRHLYLPNLNFYLKFHKDLIPEGYSDKNNEFLKLSIKYGSVLESNRDSVTQTTFNIDWSVTFHVCIVWMVYLGLTENQIDLLESIIPKTTQFILGIQILRIEFLYALLINDQTKDLNVSALNLYVTPDCFTPFLPDIPAEFLSIIQEFKGEIEMESFLKLKREYIKFLLPENSRLEIDNMNDSEIKTYFNQFDVLYIINRAYYQSINFINKLENKNEIELKYYKTNYFWPKKTEPLPRYNILVIGESGAGKSTLINTIYNYACFNDPKSIYENKTFPVINPSLEDFESKKDFLFTNLIIFASIIIKQFFGESTTEKLKSKENTVVKSSEFYLSQLLGNSEPPVNEQDNNFIHDQDYINKRLESIIDGNELPNKKDQSKSVTQQCTVYPIYFNDKIIQFIDTPGLNDTEAGIKDALNLKIINDYLKGISEIHFVLFAVNANITRIRSFVGDYLQLFDQSSLFQNNKTLFGYMFTHISQESIHTIHSLTKAISFKIFKKQIDTPIFTCDNSILQTMKDRFKGKKNDMSQEKFTALWHHNASELVRCIDNIVNSKLSLKPIAFAPESNGIVMFEYPYLATFNNSLYPYADFTLQDFENTPIHTILQEKLNKQFEIFSPINITYIQLFHLKAMRRVLFYISREFLSEKSTSNDLKLEKRYLLWQIQQLQQLQLPNVPIEDHNKKNIFMTHLSIIRYLENGDLKEQDLNSLKNEIYRNKQNILENPSFSNLEYLIQDFSTQKEFPTKKVISTEQVITDCQDIISRLSSTSKGSFVEILEKHSKIDLQRLGVWEMY